MGLLVKLILFVIKDPFLLRCETILLETLFHNHFPPQIVMLAKKNFTIFTNERVGYWCCSLITGNIYLQLIAVWLFSLQYFYFLILCWNFSFVLKAKSTSGLYATLPSYTICLFEFSCHLFLTSWPLYGLFELLQF